MDAAQPPGNEQQAQRGGGLMGGFMNNIIIFVGVYMLTNTLFKKQGTPPPQPNADGNAQQVARRSNYWNAFAKGQQINFDLYITRDEYFTNQEFETENPVWTENSIIYDSTIDTKERVFNYTYVLGDDVLVRNQSMWGHVYICKVGASANPGSKRYNRLACVQEHFPIIVFRPPIKHKKRRSLLGVPDEEPIEAPIDQAVVDPGKPVDYLPHWKPTLGLSLVEDWNSYSPSALPPQLEPFIKFEESIGAWMPVLYINEFWLLTEHLVELNQTITGQQLNLTLTWSPIGIYKWLMYCQLEQGIKTQQSMGLASAGALDDIKHILIDTNPYFLALTVAVSMLHTVFDILAFKNDIAYWKNKKDMRGMSVRAIFLNTFMQLIIFLYLMDNDTSWMVLMSAGFGVILEAWKIKKACNVIVDRSRTIPRIRFEDKESYSGETKQHDQTAIKYLTYLLIPCCLGYSIYSLIYNQHKGWYSFVLNTLVGCIYMFGFITMTPQLFINYKLKSVAHLPWKTFVYKALNTFMDDMFAFIIRMPMMHRLSCFRDDIIFLIYLYQRWIYPVDKARVNEYGQSGETPAEEAQDEAKDAQVGEAQATILPGQEAEEKDARSKGAQKPSEVRQRKQNKEANPVNDIDE